MINGDPELARRVLNKTNKALVNAMTSCRDTETRGHVQRAFNYLTFMYDILKLDEIELININNNQRIGQEPESEVKNGIC